MKQPSIDSMHVGSEKLRSRPNLSICLLRMIVLIPKPATIRVSIITYDEKVCVQKSHGHGRIRGGKLGSCYVLTGSLLVHRPMSPTALLARRSTTYKNMSVP